MSDIINKNSEVLFLYDAKRCNPNGDMDNENKPRMDWDSGKNLVSDVRLKRYIRDYLMKIKNKPIFVRKLGDKALKAKEAIGLFKKQYVDKVELKNISKKDLDIKKKEMNKIKDRIFEMIDIRLFGATIPIEVESGKGGSSNFTGPVQFNWGYSLNPIHSLQESKTITSNLSTSDSEQGAGVGKDYRVRYSFIAFSGGINSNVAKTTKLKKDDLKLLDEAMVKSIPANRTRSKIGQTPRLYIRVQLKNNESFLNDLREYIKLETKNEKKWEQIDNIKDVRLKTRKLEEYLNNNSDLIDKIFIWKDSLLETSFSDKIEGNIEIKKINL